MNVIEELDEFQKQQTELLEKKRNIEIYIKTKLNSMEKDGRKPQLIHDTLLEKVSDYHNIQPREAYKLIKDILDDNRELLVFDGTVLAYRYRITSCSCGARYSSRLSECPGCKRRER